MQTRYAILALATSIALGVGIGVAYNQLEGSVAASPQAEPESLVEELDETYLDAPQTPGDWRYDGAFTSSNYFTQSDDPVAPSFEATMASFGIDPDQRMLSVVCDLTNQKVRIVRPGQFEQSPAIRIVTETRVESFESLSHSGRYAAVELPVDAHLLDAMAITRGRFAVEMEGHPTLSIPAWPELSRVVEDCR